MNKRALRIRRIPCGDPAFGQAKRLEFEIFGVANQFTTAGDTAAGEMLTYQPWERSSEFYIGYRTDPLTGQDRAIAVARYLRYDPALGLDSFSTLRDFRSHRPQDGVPRNYLFTNWDALFLRTDPRHIAELATQAVLPGYRRFGVMEAIWRRFIEDSAADGVRIWTMALVLPLFHWYKAMLPDALHAIGQMIPDYVGADSIPAMVALDHPSMTEIIEVYDAQQAGTLPGAVTMAVSRRSGQAV